MPAMELSAGVCFPLSRMICSTLVVMVLTVMEALGIQKLSGLYLGEDKNAVPVRCTSVTRTILRSSRTVILNLRVETPLGDRRYTA